MDPVRSAESARRRAGQRLEGSSQAPDAYRVHALLDPRLPYRQPAVARRWIAAYRELVANTGRSASTVNPLAAGRGGAGQDLPPADGYFLDADRYLDDLLRLVPGSVAADLSPGEETRKLKELEALVRRTFEAPDPRSRYEAQRKLYLAKLLFDIDHCRSILDGPRHRASFEALLEKSLWSKIEGGQDVEVCCRLAAQGPGLDVIGPEVAHSVMARCWRFNVRELRDGHGAPGIQVFHYGSRLKGEAVHVAGTLADDGPVRIVSFRQACTVRAAAAGAHRDRRG